MSSNPESRHKCAVFRTGNWEITLESDLLKQGASNIYDDSFGISQMPQDVFASVLRDPVESSVECWALGAAPGQFTFLSRPPQDKFVLGHTPPVALHRSATFSRCAISLGV